MKTSEAVLQDLPFARDLLREPCFDLLDRHIPPSFVALNSKRVPVDPEYGHGLRGWQATRSTAQAIRDQGDHYTQLGLLTGLPSGLLVFDLDGTEAIDLAMEHGCDPWKARTWRTVRLNALDRVKVFFSAPPEVIEAMTTLHLSPGRHGVGLDFLGTGAQAAIFGRHRTGARIHWLNDPSWVEPRAGLPGAPGYLPLEWEQFYWRLRQTKEDYSTPRPSIDDIARTGGNWITPVECAICGRPKSKDHDCRMRSDGKRAQCKHGNSYKPPEGLRPREVIKGHDGQRWRYHETVERSGSMAGIHYSKFSLVETSTAIRRINDHF